LLDAQPQNPGFWLGLAIAYQLVNEPKSGVKVLKAFFEAKVSVS
jgi:peptide alpha-N-acetyltransferase